MSTNAGLLAVDGGTRRPRRGTSGAARISASTVEHDEPLDLAQVVVLAAGDARDGRRDERLPAAAVAAHHLDERAALVGVRRCERDREARPGRAYDAVGVEQVDARTGRRGRGCRRGRTSRGSRTQRVQDRRSTTSRSPAAELESSGRPPMRVEQHLAARLRVQQRDRPVVDRPWASSRDAHASTERRDERVVVRPAVLAEEVGQQDVDEASRRPLGGARSRIRGRSALPAAVRRVVADLDRVGEDDADRRARGTTASASCCGQLDVAASDRLVGLGAVDPGEVDDDVGVCDQLSRAAGVARARRGPDGPRDRSWRAQPAGGCASRGSHRPPVMTTFIGRPRASARPAASSRWIGGSGAAGA